MHYPNAHAATAATRSCTPHPHATAATYTSAAITANIRALPRPAVLP